MTAFGLARFGIIYDGNGERQLTPERNAIDHTHGRASSEHAGGSIASSSAKSCRKMRTVPGRNSEQVINQLRIQACHQLIMSVGSLTQVMVFPIAPPPIMLGVIAERCTTEGSALWCGWRRFERGDTGLFEHTFLRPELAAAAAAAAAES
jgi:hypothetical protein